MRYLGKFIGIMLGIISGTHIWGVIIGFVIGHAYDKALEEQNLEKIDTKQNLQTLFIINTFKILGHITKAKGAVTKVDIRLATNLMDKMHLYADARILAQEAFRNGKEQAFPLKETLKELRKVCFNRFDLIQMFLEIQIQAALADGILHPKEKKILFTIAEDLGISYDQFDQFLYIINNNQEFEHNSDYNYRSNTNSYSHSNQDIALLNACKILGVKLDDEDTQIKRAYRKLMAEHHPDKLVAKKLAPEMMEIAKQKTQSIQAAYDLIKKKRRFK